MLIYLYVGVGGIIGSLLRYSISIWSSHLFGTGFPFGTIFVNLTGAFLLGWFTTRIIHTHKIPPNLATGFGTGLVGSYTTFSTFSIEIIALAEEGAMLSLFLYFLISSVGGLLMAYAGYSLGEKKQVGEKQ